MWVLWWCNATHSSIPNALVGAAFIRPGGCADIQHANDSSVCTGAGEVPCRLANGEGLCTAGSNSYTIVERGSYDGKLKRTTGTSTFRQAFTIGDGRIYLKSVAALGFTNYEDGGRLMHNRKLWVMCQGAPGCTDAMFSVYDVKQSDNSLGVTYEHEFSYAAGIVLSLNETCTASLVHETIIFPLWTSTPGAFVYFNIPGTEPTIASQILGPENSLAFNVSTETSFRAVAAGDNLMNSPYLHVDVTRPCGNGIINGGEQCDDGNLVDGDECSSQCMFERRCEDAIWQDVSWENIGIHYMDLGPNNSNPDALHVSQSPANATGLTSDCHGYIIISQVTQFQSGGRRTFVRPSTKGRIT